MFGYDKSMIDEEGKSAYIYNFKNKDTCPMCVLVELAFDLGGNDMVKDRFGFDYKEHFHGGFGCYWQSMFYAQSYGGEKNVDLEQLKKIAKSNFRVVADFTGDNFFLKEANKAEN